MPKKLAAHSLDDKAMAFLVTLVAATKMKVCPFFSSSSQRIFLLLKISQNFGKLREYLLLRLQLKLF